MFSLLIGSSIAFLSIWRGQADADSVLINLKPQTSLLVIFNQLARSGWLVVQWVSFSLILPFL